MRIVLVPSSAPLTCVYCHDALGAASLDACTRCGTRYHRECAALSGSCALIGCDGAFENASSGRAADARLALVLRPGGEATRERLAAVARVLRATEWDARQRLGSPVPTVLGYFTRSGLAHATADLEAANVAAFAIDAAALAGPERFVVRSADETPAGLLVRDPSGREEPLAPGATAVLVVARYAVDTGGPREVAPDGEDGRPGKYGRKVLGPRTASYTRVLHAYSATGRVVVFDESVLDDFRFLGPRMTASSTQNFAVLASFLSVGARLVDRSLEKAQGGHLRTLPPDASRISRRTNRAWIDATSLLIFHASEDAAAAEVPKSEKGSQR